VRRGDNQTPPCHRALECANWLTVRPFPGRCTKLPSDLFLLVRAVQILKAMGNARATPPPCPPPRPAPSRANQVDLVHQTKISSVKLSSRMSTSFSHRCGALLLGKGSAKAGRLPPALGASRTGGGPTRSGSSVRRRGGERPGGNAERFVGIWSVAACPQR
jgi:hypothetical protein